MSSKAYSVRPFRYSKITNIVAVLSPPGIEDQTPVVLLNCHLDTALSSGGGAGDDASGCAILLETARILSTRPAAFAKNPVAFLFNGNEEGGLNGAHMFLSRPTSVLARKSKLVINLESAGSTGPPAVFQLRSRNLLKAYAKGATSKHLNVVFNDVFRTGVLVSDTDFRHWGDEGIIEYDPEYRVPANWSAQTRKVFPLEPRRKLLDRTYGGDPNIIGMDFATYSDSYRYHTPLDQPTAIPKGTVEHWGADVWGTVHNILEMRLDETWKSGSGDNVEGVWFDVFGWLVSYGGSAMVWGHAVVGLLGLGGYLVVLARLFGRANLGVREKASLALRMLAVSVATPIGALVGSVFAAYLVRFHPLGQELLFFSWEPLPTLLYAPAAILGALAARKLCFLFSTSEPDEDLELLSNLPLVSAVTLLMTRAGLGSAYLAAAQVVGLLILLLFPRSRSFFPIFNWIVGVPPIFAAWRFFVPLFGRVGTAIPVAGAGLAGLDAARWLTDLIAAGQVGVLTWAVGWPIFVGLRRHWKVVALVAGALGVLGPVVLSPFDADHPKRAYMQLSYNITAEQDPLVLHIGHADRGWTSFDRFVKQVVPDGDSRHVWERIAEQGPREGEWDIGWPRSPMLGNLRVDGLRFAPESRAPDKGCFPWIEVVSDIRPQGSKSRELLLRFHHRGLISPTVAFGNCRVEKWDLEGGKPVVNDGPWGNRTVVKHHAGFGASSWEIELIVESEREDGKIHVDFWGVDPSIFGSGEKGSWGAYGGENEGRWWSPALDRVKRRAPDWSTLTLLASVGGSWWI